MRIREKIARFIAPGLKGETEIRELVKEEVRAARMGLPITANYDPNNEGYRRLMGQNQQLRDLSGINQDRMFDVAYFMWDNSPMFKRLAKMDKTFLFAEPITITSDDDDVQTIIDRFWNDPENNLPIKLADKMMWLGILGEQCWPVEVNEHNGHVRLLYMDPSRIKTVNVNRENVEQVQRVDMQGTAGGAGKKYAVIRKDHNATAKTYGRLVGDCFFFAINHPPNSPRGRSDFLTLFDWIDALERYGFNVLERAEFMLNFVWDVLLKGMTEDQIREWLQDNKAPEPGSLRAHNEQVEWKAVSPDIKAYDHSKGFDAAKGFILGSHGRPESWYGAGGKAYQTEADLMGMVPIKDLDERQQYIKHIAGQLLQFQVDQAVIHGRLTEKKAEAGFAVNMPEISKKEMAKLIAGVPQLTAALAVAEERRWVRRETATKIFASVVTQMGQEVNAEEEIEAAASAAREGLEDYLGQD